MKPFVFLLTLDRESTDRCFLYAHYGNPLVRNAQERVVREIRTLRAMWRELETE